MSDSLDDVSGSGLDGAKELGNKAKKKVGKEAKKIGKKAGKQVNKQVKKAGKQVAKKGGKTAVKAARNIAKGLKMAGKIAAKAVAKLVKLIIKIIIKLIAILGVWGLAILAILVVVMMCLKWFDIRGPEGRYQNAYGLENVVSKTDATYKALALLESEALVSAYYKYMSVNSIIKYYDGTEYYFSDSSQTADYAGLMDLYKRENYFFLTSSFIQMADETLHNEEFYFPEQIIKAVKYNIVDGYVETQHLFEGDSLTAESKAWNNAGTSQTSADELGIWDYGLGSVLQYEVHEKDKVMSYNYSYFDVHVHETWEEQVGDVFGVPVWETKEKCRGNLTIFPEEGMTELEITELVRTKIDEAFSYSVMPADVVTQSHALHNASDSSVLSEVINNNNAWSRGSPIEYPVAVTADDRHIASRTFIDGNLSDFRNHGDSTTYPINVPVISAAATLSGNIQYQYTERKTSEEIPYGYGPLDATVTRVTLESNTRGTSVIRSIGTNNSGCGGFTLNGTRFGLVTTTAPWPIETTDGWGLQYLEDYSQAYTIYIPQDLSSDYSFADRLGAGLNSDDDDYKSMVLLGVLEEVVDTSLIYIGNGTAHRTFDVTLYANNSLNVVESMAPLQSDTLVNNAFIQDILSMFREGILVLADRIDWVFDSIGSIFVSSSSGPRERYTSKATATDIRNVVFNTFSFERGESYLDMADLLKNDLDESFIFLGAKPGINSGTSTGEFFIPPGLGTLSTTTISPTKGYVVVDKNYNDSTGIVELFVPKNTPVFAVSDYGVTNNGSGSFSMTFYNDTDRYTLTVSNLSTTYGVSSGSYSKGTQIGLSKSDGSNIKLKLVDSSGNKLNPMDFFYLSSEGGPEFLLIDESGPTLGADLEAILTKDNNKTTNNVDAWHAYGSINTSTMWSDIWWAWGRGVQYLDSTGYPPASLPSSFGNVNSYLNSTSGIFEQGYTPKQYSWIVMEGIDGATGYIGFVEAVGMSDGSSIIDRLYVSYCRDEKIVVDILVPDADGLFTFNNRYERAKFIYLNSISSININIPSWEGIPLLDEEMELILQNCVDYALSMGISLSSERMSTIAHALSLVGRVPYFWGGGHGSYYEGDIYYDGWGYENRPIIHDGSNTYYVGSLWSYGLDCSGFGRWATHMGVGTDLRGDLSRTSLVTRYGSKAVVDLIPGDWAEREGHTGIFLYLGADGQRYYVHENGTARNVSVNALDYWEYGINPFGD